MISYTMKHKMYTCGNKGGKVFHIPSQLIKGQKIIPYSITINGHKMYTCGNKGGKVSI
jgi:hypothetical protein